jgi:hypothetical protein
MTCHDQSLFILWVFLVGFQPQPSIEASEQGLGEGIWAKLTAWEVVMDGDGC